MRRQRSNARRQARAESVECHQPVDETLCQSKRGGKVGDIGMAKLALRSHVEKPPGLSLSAQGPVLLPAHHETSGPECTGTSVPGGWS